MLNEGHILDGKYKVIRVLGNGGMSTVYLCENMRLQNHWAIKEIPGTLKYNVDFLTEPNILKKLKHPGIPRIIDIFNEMNNQYIVEDYIEGNTLEEVIKRDGKFRTEDICKIAIELCDILEYLHSFNPPIIYRDLKPSNIMITKEGKVVLIDFGISRVYKKEQNEDTVFLGSRGYAAPEQFGTMQSGKQTDIYGLGATMYFMAIGKAPENITEPFNDEGYGKNINFKLRDIIKKSMQIEMNNRFESIEILREALNNVLIKESETRILKVNNVKDKTHDTKPLGPDINKSNEKTRFLNNFDEKASSLGSNVNQEKTMIMNKKVEKPHKKRKLYKIAAIGIIMVIIYLMCAKLLYIMTDKKDISNNEKPKINREVQKPPAVKEVEKETFSEDFLIEGTIYKDYPIISKVLTDKDLYKDGNGKKGKKKKDSYGEKIKYSLYELKPQGEAIKYNKNIIISLEKLEIVNDIFVGYLTIENKSNKNIGIEHGSNTFLIDTRGNKIKPYESLSTDISNVTKGQTIRNAKVVFKGFSMEKGVIKINSKLEIDDPLYTSRDVSIVINIK